MLSVTCSELQVDHLIDSIFDYFAICRVQIFVFFNVHWISKLRVQMLVERVHSVLSVRLPVVKLLGARENGVPL